METNLQKATDASAWQVVWPHEFLQGVVRENTKIESARVSWPNGQRSVDETMPGPFLAGLPDYVDKTTGKWRPGRDVWNEFLAERNRDFVQAAAASLGDSEFINALLFRLQSVAYYDDPALHTFKDAYHVPARELLKRHCTASQWLLAMNRHCVNDCGIDPIHLSDILGDIEHASDIERITNRAAFNFILKCIKMIQNRRKPTCIQHITVSKPNPLKPSNIGADFHDKMCEVLKRLPLNAEFSRQDFGAIPGDDTQKSNWLKAMASQGYAKHNGKSGRGSGYTKLAMW